MGADKTTHVLHNSYYWDHSFLAKTCFDLETATLNFNHIGVQTSILRIGVVLSLSGGLIKKTIKYARKHINPKLGTGSQYINWIQDFQPSQDYQNRKQFP